MVRLEENKHDTQEAVIEKLPLPARVYIPLSQHIGKLCQPLVKSQDYVLLGQKIAAANAHVYAPVHASVSGKVTGIQDWPHPVLGRCKTIIIENDRLDKSQTAGPRPQTEIDNLTPEQLRGVILEAGIVGMGGASFPTHIKLNPPKPVDTLIINCAECEPYLASDYRLMVERTQDILKGIGLVARCLGVGNVYIAIEDNKPEAVKKFKAQSGKFKLKVLKSAYPQGGEKQLAKKVLNKEVPSGRLPFDIGIVVQNVATCLAIFEAVYLAKPLYERVVTVAGSCVPGPKNLLVRIGTPVRELIDFCGPLREEPVKVIAGGPMMGITQYNLDAGIIKSTNGILCFAQGEVTSAQEAPCIRCGRCVEYCPVGLMPAIINSASEKEKWDLARDYACLDCMECGLCSYICPQRINLLQNIKRAKLEVAK